MLNAIRPILVTQVPSISWKLDSQKTAYQNLFDLLTITKTVRTTIEQNSTPVPDHLRLREVYKTILDETNQSLDSLIALETHFDSDKTRDDGSKLQNKSPEKANRAFLLLQANESHLRRQSVEFGPAWTEIEAQYQLKVTMYHFLNELPPH